MWTGQSRDPERLQLCWAWQPGPRSVPSLREACPGKWIPVGTASQAQHRDRDDRSCDWERNQDSDEADRLEDSAPQTAHDMHLQRWRCGRRSLWRPRPPWPRQQRLWQTQWQKCTWQCRLRGDDHRESRPAMRTNAIDGMPGRERQRWLFSGWSQAWWRRSLPKTQM